MIICQTEVLLIEDQWSHHLDHIFKLNLEPETKISQLFQEKKWGIWQLTQKMS